MYAQAAIKPNTLLRNGAYGIVMRGVHKCTCAGASLRGRYSAPLCCIKLDTATDTACGSGAFLIEAGKKVCNLQKTKLIGIEKDMVLANLTNKRIKKLYGETHYVICEDTLKIDQISFEPDIILANPPYGINIDGEPSEKVFIKKNIEMLKNEGVMAIIIPDGILGNDGNSELRKWILTQCRILAIIDLPKSDGSFRPWL